MTIATGLVTTNAPIGRFFRMEANIFLDANVIYEAGSKAMRGSKFKYSTQLFEMNHLLYTAMIQKSLREGS